MKSLLKTYLITLFALWVVQRLISGFKIESGIENLFLAALVLSLLNVIVKPILKILFIPINIATFGFFTLVINALIIFLLDYLFVQIQVTSWRFPGISFQGISFPASNFGIIGTYFTVSLTISLITTVLKWLLDK